MEQIKVKNMVCHRCILAVEQILNDLDIRYLTVQLGDVTFNEPLTADQLNGFTSALTKVGFEIIQERKSLLVEEVKAIVIQIVYHQKEQLKVNLSEYISSKLSLDYSYISKTFSEIEGKTIEKYVMEIKVERVKELIQYDQQTLTEIANDLHYSSVAHLSAQFKKVTGVTPTKFKQESTVKRSSLS